MTSTILFKVTKNKTKQNKTKNKQTNKQNQKTCATGPKFCILGDLYSSLLLTISYENQQFCCCCCFVLAKDLYFNDLNIR